MKTIIFTLFTMLAWQQAPVQNVPTMPKVNPNGVWVTEAGTKFQFQLTGKDLKVQLVDGKSKYLKYDLTLKNQEEVNTYKGGGSFVAKLSNGKECKFDTEWQLTVVMSNKLFLQYLRITPDPENCAIVDSSLDQMFLTKDTDAK